MSEELEFKLTKEEILVVQSIINDAVPKVYTLKQLFGPKRWSAIGSGSERQEYGARFMASLQARELDNIKLYPKKTSANAVQYTVN